MKFNLHLSRAALVLPFLVFCICGAYAAETPQRISFWGIVVDDAGGKGVRIEAVRNDSWAGMAGGLNPGDVLLSINGVAVRSAQEFRAVKNNFPLYTPLKLTVNRKGALIERQIVLSGIVPLEVKAIKPEFTIPGVPLPPALPAAALSAIDALDVVNVLDQVVLDPGSGKIAVIGHHDARFNTGPLPYLDLLKTAMTNPAPKLDLPDDVEHKAEKPTWNWPSRDFILGHPDLELERQLVIRDWASASGVSPEELVSLFNYVNFSAKERVPPPGIRAVLGKALNHLGFAETAQAFDLVNQDGTDAPLKALQLLGRNAEAQSILARSGGDAARARGTLIASVYLAMLENIHASEATVAALRDDLAAGRSTWQETVEKAQGQMMPSRSRTDKRDIALSALNRIMLSTKASRALLGQPLNDLRTWIATTDLDRTSQLARILYEADYSLKSLMVAPHLFRRIRGSMSNQEYEISKGKNYARVVTEHWLEPGMVSMTVSPGRRVVAFGTSEMKYDTKATVSKGLADKGVVIDHYYDDWCAVLMNNYDEYARILPSFHKVREAAKIVAFANWLISEKVRVDLGGVAQEKWNPPDKLPGFWRVALVYVEKGDDQDVHKGVSSVQFAYSGGVTFKNRSNWTRMTPSVTSETSVTSQLALSAGLGQQAVQAAQSGNLENARYLAELSAQAMTGSLSKTDLAKINIPVPQGAPAPVSPAGVQLQTELLKATNAQIKGLTQSSDPGKRAAALSLLNGVYDSFRANPVAASDYLLKLQTGQLHADSATPTAPRPGLPKGAAASETLTPGQCQVAERRVAAYRDALRQTVEVAERFSRTIAADQALRAQWEERMTAASERAKSRGQFLWLALPLGKLQRLNGVAGDLLDKDGAELADLLAGATDPARRDAIRLARQFVAREKEVVGRLGKSYANINDAVTLGGNAPLMLEDPDASPTSPFKGDGMKLREAGEMLFGLITARDKWKQLAAGAPWAKYLAGGLSTAFAAEAAARAMFDSWYDAFDAALAWEQLYKMNLDSDRYLQAVQKLQVEMRRRSDRLDSATKEFTAECTNPR